MASVCFVMGNKRALLGRSKQCLVCQTCQTHPSTSLFQPHSLVQGVLMYIDQGQRLKTESCKSFHSACYTHFSLPCATAHRLVPRNPENMDVDSSDPAALKCTRTQPGHIAEYNRADCESTLHLLTWPPGGCHFALR